MCCQADTEQVNHDRLGGHVMTVLGRSECMSICSQNLLFMVQANGK